MNVNKCHRKSARSDIIVGKISSLFILMVIAIGLIDNGVVSIIKVSELHVRVYGRNSVHELLANEIIDSETKVVDKLLRLIQ